MNLHDGDTSSLLLAEGFADHVAAWATEKPADLGKPIDARTRDIVHRAAFLASLATSDGHVCAALDALHDATGIDTGELRRILLQSGVVGSAQEPGAMPLILDGAGRLYLHRYFDYEKRLARRLLGTRCAPPAIGDAVRDRLRALFAGNAPRLGGRPDWQMLAAALALRSPVTIISGGPGTGKTTTVVNILGCLLEQKPTCRIALAAPTGKAAARMLEAIRARADHLPEHIQAMLPDASYTVHRLLGVTPTTGVFRHDAANPLAIDVLILDEASMLDLAMAVKLFEAVPPASRIILLGDKDQLAAVESGAVFSELCADPTLTPDCIAELSALTAIAAERIATAAPIRTTSFHDSVVWFSDNFRFHKDSGIGQLAAGIGVGDPGAVTAWLRAYTGDEISWTEEGGEHPCSKTLATIVDGYADYVAAVSAPQQTGPDLQTVFEALGRFRVLCALRSTHRGVESLNRVIADRLRPLLGGTNSGSTWYVGRPVMILRNDYSLRVFNGDIGIAMPDATGELMVWFPDQETGFRAVAPGRLPAHETAFAMTIHKSQGSEFDRVLLVLPDQPNKIITRELLYTGVTRARKHADIAGPARVLEHAIRYPTRRHSGLLDRMRELVATPEATG